MALLIEKPWRTQPTGPVTVDWTNPITQRLLFARIGGSRTATWPSAALSRTGTKIIGTIAGAADAFGATSGVASTDRVQLFNTLRYATETSFFAIYNRTTANGGRIFDQRFGELFLIGSTTGILQVESARWFDITGVWQSASNEYGSELNKWFSVAVTYEATLTTNVPKVYINARPITMTQTTAPAGIVLAPSTSDAFTLGNNVSGTRSYNGYVAETYIWNRILTPAEIFSIHSNPYQIFRPLELQLGPSNFPRIYYVAGPNSTWATPTSTQIINGQLSGGGAATASWSESAPLQTTTPFNFSQPASPLTTGTKYRAAAVQKAGDSNVVSNVVESDPFLAGAATLSNPEAVNITDTAATPKVTVSY